MELFKHGMLRICGESFDTLEKLKIDFSDNIMAFKALVATQAAEQAALVEKLFEHIKGTTDAILQKKLLNIKRDVFNTRLIKAKELSFFSDKIDDSLYKELLAWNEGLEQRRITELDLSKAYQNESNKVSRRFLKLANADLFKKGLILGSHDLLDRLLFYAGRPDEPLTNKYYHAEQGLMKYYSRMVAKTSPFSTFTNLSVFNYGDTANEAVYGVKDGAEKITSGIRLNNYLLMFLKNCLKQYRPFAQTLRIKANPSIRISDDGYVFLVNENNTESFQRLASSELLTYILEVIDEEANVTLQALTAILAEAVEAETDEISAYLSKLLRYGLLEYEFYVSGNDPNWIPKLLALLDNQKGLLTPIANLVDALQQIEQHCREYEAADTEQRIKLILHIYNLFFKAYIELHEAAGLPAEERDKMTEAVEASNKGENIDLKKFYTAQKDKEKVTKEEFAFSNATLLILKPKNILYEDTIRDPFLTVNKLVAEDLIATLNQCFIELSHFDYYEDSKKSYAAYFAEQYAGASTVSLLQFYEDYARQKKQKKLAETRKIEREDQTEKEADTLSDYEKKVEAWQQTFINILKAASPVKHDVVNIPLRVIAETNIAESIPTKNYNCSVGTFGQIFKNTQPDGPSHQMVINGVFPGHGKMMSRFLHLFDPSVTENTIKWNAGFAQDELFAENADASSFNGNIHPLLMPYQISVPSGHFNTSEEYQIPVKDIFVAVEKDKESLKLVDKKGRRIVVFDLGFQGLIGRSALYRMLNSFSTGYIADFGLLVSSVNNHFSKSLEDKIVVCPRIMVEDRIVIQRKLWVVNHTHFPAFAETDSLLKKLIAVKDWQKSIGLPDEFFIWFNRYNDEPNEKVEQGYPKDAEKPQYIHLSNPILVQLLLKYLQFKRHLNIAEMLPGSSDLLQIGDNKFVTELLIQWEVNNKATH